MAFGRLERNPGAQPMSDINMTPLIDVMLVLLVIFMITAPLMTSSLKLDLPKTDAAQPNDAPQFIAVALDKDGRTFYGDEAVDAGGIRRADRRRGAGSNPQTEVQLRADQSVPYGRVAELIGVVQKAGLSGSASSPTPRSSARGAAAPQFVGLPAGSAGRDASAGVVARAFSSLVVARRSRTEMLEPVRYSRVDGGSLPAAVWESAAQPAASAATTRASEVVAREVMSRGGKKPPL